MKLIDILEEINNFFIVTTEKKSLTLTANTIIGDFAETYVAGQYIRIANTILNDDVYKITNVAIGTITIDETFEIETVENGVIQGLAIPNSLLKLANEMMEDGHTASIESEKVSRYSVVYGESGGSWQKVYRYSLDRYRKLRWN